MTKRLVPPPVLVIDEEAQDENRLNGSSKEMSNLDALPLDEEIKKFNEELDKLEKSFDDLSYAANNNNRKSTSGSSFQSTPFSSSRRPRSTFSTSFSTTRKAPLQMKDPPPSAELLSPLRRSFNSTPARKMSPYTPGERPPPPVESPAIYPAPDSTPNVRRRRSREFSSEQPSSAAREPPEIHEPQDVEYSTPKPTWEDTLDRMRQTLTQQENRIRELELENEKLKQQVEDQDVMLRHRDEQLSSYRRPSAPIPESGPAAHHETHNSSSPPQRRRPREYNISSRVELNGRPGASIASNTYRTTPMSSPNHIPSIRSPPRRIDATLGVAHVIPEEDGSFTAGTKFVAELASLMELEEGHQVPLSLIMDKHWDHLKHHFQEEDF